MFAKPPVPGQVKTRLAQTIGNDAAASFASAMLCDVWSTIHNCAPAVPVLAAAEEGPFPVAVPEENFWLQGTGELGSRIEHVLRRGLRNAPAAIAIGADSPLLKAGDLENALLQLETGDAVIGPSCDGGFYLFGLHRCPLGLLRKLPWSTPETRNSTVERLHSHGMTVFELRTLLDVDTFADLQLLQGELLDSSPEIAPATRRWFAEHRSRLQELQWSAS